MNNSPYAPPTEDPSTPSKPEDMIKPAFRPKCALAGLFLAIPCFVPMIFLRAMYGVGCLGGSWQHYAHWD